MTTMQNPHIKTQEEIKKLAKANDITRPGDRIDNPYRAELNIYIQSGDIEAVLEMIKAKVEHYFEAGYRQGERDAEHRKTLYECKHCKK